MRIAVYMVTNGHEVQTKRVINLLHKASGVKFDLFVADSGSGNGMFEALNYLKSEGKIHWLRTFSENVGQNIGANACLDAMEDGDYDWIVSWSPDVEPKGRRVLKKLCRAMQDFHKAGVDVLASPKISGAEAPTALTAVGNDIGFPYYEGVIIKGYVRAHPVGFFKDWRFNVYGALALGESAEVKDHAEMLKMPCVVVMNIKARHVGEEPDLIAQLVGYGL